MTHAAALHAGHIAGRSRVAREVEERLATRVPVDLAYELAIAANECWSPASRHTDNELPIPLPLEQPEERRPTLLGTGSAIDRMTIRKPSLGHAFDGIPRNVGRV